MNIQDDPLVGIARAILEGKVEIQTIESDYSHMSEEVDASSNLDESISGELKKAKYAMFALGLASLGLGYNAATYKIADVSFNKQSDKIAQVASHDEIKTYNKSLKGLHNKIIDAGHGEEISAKDKAIAVNHKKLVKGIYHKYGIKEELDIIKTQKEILEGASHKFGDMVPAASLDSSDLVYETEKIDHKWGNFDRYLDPTEGAGGGNRSLFVDDQWSKFSKAHKLRYTVFGYMIDLFTPKSKTLLALSKQMCEWPAYQSSPEKYALIDKVKETYTHVGVVRTTESYRFIIDEATWKALPSEVIGNTSYDYSFHAGEGTVDSFLMAIGDSEGDVKSKLKKALSKVKAEYIGNAMELKYAQKGAVGR